MSLPVEVHYPELAWPFPLASAMIIDWEFTVDALKSEAITVPHVGTQTTTLSGAGSGSFTVYADPTRHAVSSQVNVTAGAFLVTRVLSASPSAADLSQNFRLWLASAGGAGSYSITQVVEENYDDPSFTDLSTTYTDADDAAVVPLRMKIGRETVEVTHFSITGENSSMWLASWLPPNAWTFDRPDLFTAQTFTAAATAGDLGYDSGSGWDQSVTFTLSPWVY